MQTSPPDTTRWPFRRPSHPLAGSGAPHRAAGRRAPHRPATRIPALLSAWCLLLATVAVGLGVVGAGVTEVGAPTPAGAQADDNGPNWLPFVSNNNPAIQLWCSWSNPGPASNPSFCSGYHPTPALDVGMPIGTPVYASGKGTVAVAAGGCVAGDDSAAKSCNGSAGNYVAIAHPNGVYSRYLHLSSLAVSVNQAVDRGDLIGYSGNTGAVYPTSAAHLHFDVVTSIISPTRIDPGPLSAEQNGQIVSYPSVLGYAGWNSTPYGTTFANDAVLSSEPVLPPPPPPPPPPANGAGFHAVVPFRALDSRTTTGGWTGALPAGSTRPLTIAGVNGIPASASAVVMNVTVTGATGPGYLTTFPYGADVPTTANLLFGAGQTVPNLVTVGIGSLGSVGVRAAFTAGSGRVHVIADVVGWFDDGTDPSGALFHGMTPTRALDSRDPNGPWSGWKIGAETRSLAVAGVGGVPADASAVVMNVTATDLVDPGILGTYLRVSPTGAPAGTTANLLVPRNQTIPNLVTVAVGTGGMIDIFNQQGYLNVVVDVVGWFSADPGGGRFHPVTPTRMLDSRTGAGGWSGPWGANTWRNVAVGDNVTVPADASGVVVNVTATNASQATYLSASPGGTPNPGTANLLVGAQQTVPNLAMVGVSGGAVTVYNQQGSVDVVGDVSGWYR